MSKRFTVRNESPSDVQTVSDITTSAFLTNPYSSHTEQLIIASLRRSSALSLSLVAEIGGQVVGHIAFSQVTISDGSTEWYGLGPISVAPALQRRGIGQAMVREGLAILRDRGAKGCVVFGPPKYYQRFGFAATRGLTFVEPPPEHFMALYFGASRPIGEVTYHGAFNVRG
ncbi:MAG: N-acetyltransferase [Opitutaceae bacterium]|jgi:putative acetyltransferase